MIRKQYEKANNFENEEGAIISDAAGIKMRRGHYEQLYSNVFKI